MHTPKNYRLDTQNDRPWIPGDSGFISMAIFGIYITLEVQPPFLIGWFPNHHYFKMMATTSRVYKISGVSYNSIYNDRWGPPSSWIPVFFQYHSVINSNTLPAI